MRGAFAATVIGGSVFCAVAGSPRTAPTQATQVPVEQPAIPAPIVSTSKASPTETVPRKPHAAFLHTEAGNRAPFDEPNAWVHVPVKFDPNQRLKVVIFFHGFHNCLRSFVADEGLPCRPFQSPRTAYGIAAQMERAELGAIAVVPQLAFDRDSSDPMRLAEPGAARALLKEIIEKHLRDAIGPRTIDDVEDVTFVAASGGHEALAPVLEKGNVPNVHRVVLMDAYYAASSALESFVVQNLDAFDAGRSLAVVYTDGEPTLGPTLGFVARITERLRTRGKPDRLRHAAKPHEVVPADFAAPISFVHSVLGHDEVMRHDLWKVLKSG